MKKQEIIKKSGDFTRIIQKSEYYKNNFFVVYKEKNEDNKLKFGITISKKTGNAVVRNKLKRQIKNIIDNNKFLFKNNYNYIIMVRVICVDKPYKLLNDSLISLVEEKVNK